MVWKGAWIDRVDNSPGEDHPFIVIQGEDVARTSTILVLSKTNNVCTFYIFHKYEKFFHKFPPVVTNCVPPRDVLSHRGAFVTSQVSVACLG
jgi:hypothetical protein